MRRKVRVGKSTDGLLGAKNLRKPRHYAEIDNIDGKSVVSKIYTHDENNPKHKERMNKGLRKPIKSFGSKSVIDKSLYIEKEDKSPIYENELDFEKSNYEFDEEESKMIRRFIFSSKKNRERYERFVKKYKKRTQRDNPWALGCT